MDRLNAMSAFVSVAELRGFAAAARRLHLSPAAVTRLIAGLEDHLGIVLLQRTTRSVNLTEAGARFLDDARLILAAVAEAEDGARARRTTPSGRLVVAAPLMFGRLEVAPLMCDFLAAYPAVVGELSLADRAVSLVDEGVDVAVRIGHLDDSSLRVRVVGKTRRVVVGSPAYLRKRRARLKTPAHLPKHALIHFTAMTATPEWRFGAGAREQRIAFAPALVTNSADAAIGHAERGGGLTMALAYQVAHAVRDGRLEIVLEQYEPPPLPIQLVQPAARLVSANVRAFGELAAKRPWVFVDL
jgi:DNA-binding transcriptional LysR family regulator